jgi:hypothetical protein
MKDFGIKRIQEVVKGQDYGRISLPNGWKPGQLVKVWEDDTGRLIIERYVEVQNDDTGADIFVAV